MEAYSFLDGHSAGADSSQGCFPVDRDDNNVKALRGPAGITKVGVSVWQEIVRGNIGYPVGLY